jgi:hypothetical protein
LHGKLIAHSANPDQVYDAVNTVLWNQHVYIFFNGDFEALKASYGSQWEQQAAPAEVTGATSTPPPLPDDLGELIYSAVDQLYGNPNLNEAIRRLRLARVRANIAADARLITLLDQALDQIETSRPPIDDIIWGLEEGLAELE